MKKYISIFTVFAIMATMTACSSSTDESAPVAAQPTAIATEVTTEITTEITAETTKKPTVYWSTENAARTFADLVYDELENNKTSDNPTYFKLLNADRKKVEGVTDYEAMNSDVFLMDVNYDGVPELLTGAYGMVGRGKYSIYSMDGISFGTAMFTSEFYYDMCIIDDCMFVPSGSYSNWGWTKFSQGMPTVRYLDFISENESNDVEVILNGETEVLTNLTNDEAKAVFKQYLGVEYDSLVENFDRSCLYVRGCLEVPDAENYTQEDIYNTLLPMIKEYKEKSLQQ